ncbi:hypothetical protein DENSPDRAFT_831403 [Dentipellis sp. KUC8613]|nr:hypothetical protein DENSPDRAFT_831403 [Dentipellis sp. KUC8613]
MLNTPTTTATATAVQIPASAKSPIFTPNVQGTNAVEIKSPQLPFGENVAVATGGR